MWVPESGRIDADVQPHKSAGFNTGVPAPVGAGLAFAPVYLWLITGNDLFRDFSFDTISAAGPNGAARASRAAVGR